MIIKFIISVIVFALLFWVIFEFGKKFERKWLKYLITGGLCLVLSCVILFVIVQLF